jgi:cytochrome c peroxidase
MVENPSAMCALAMLVLGLSSAVVAQAPRASDPLLGLPSLNEKAYSADTVALGQKLFFDKRLSVSGVISCSSCHEPALAFSDGRARAVTMAC